MLVSCLLTTQQRSGPGSAVHRFMRTTPFPPALEACGPSGAGLAARSALESFGGIRRWETIAEQIGENALRLHDDGWNEVEDTFESLLASRSRDPDMTDVAVERTAANFIDDRLVGFGPKQARNFWQSLGLTRFEIPIDSRVVGWLKGRGLELSTAGLADRTYYEFVEAGVRALCGEAGALPCVLDAAIFVAADRARERQ